MPRGRIPDSERDVYGDFAMQVMNAVRQAEKANTLMSEGEYEIVKSIRARFEELDPGVSNIARARVRTY